MARKFKSKATTFTMFILLLLPITVSAFHISMMSGGGTNAVAKNGASMMSSMNGATTNGMKPVTASPKLESLVPQIIQGGMGIRISSWKLAREVSKMDQLGVISGTAMDTVLVRALQSGDEDGVMRRALATFHDQDMVQRILTKYYIENGKDDKLPYKSIPMWSTKPSQHLLEVTVLANYAEVWLAKHEDDGTPTNGLIGINLLTKVQLPTIPSLYGAMLAGVDYVLMGAGIPMSVPGYLDNLAQGTNSRMALDYEGKLPEGVEEPIMEFSPREFWKNANNLDLFENVLHTLPRPHFLPIVSSVVLAQSMLKRASGAGPTRGIQGFVIELNTAGGHNAPPRGFRYDAVAKSHTVDLNERGEPIYGPKDEVDLLKFGQATKGLPFWLAGSYARPDKFAEVLAMGGTGVQVGSAFSLTKESGMKEHTRQQILHRLAETDLDVYTDPVASPTGFPFKVLNLPGTLAESDEYKARPRICNLGYLRTAYVSDAKTGEIKFRCASEPIDAFLKKGGAIEATEGRKCLCNALCADTGYPQVSPKKRTGETDNYVEQPLVTVGDDVNGCRRFMKYDEGTDTWSYSASDVVKYLLSEWESRVLEHEGGPEVVLLQNGEEKVVAGMTDVKEKQLKGVSI